MVVGFTTSCGISAFHQLSCELKSCWWWGVLDTTVCDKVCQRRAAGRWFSPCTPVSSINETDYTRRYSWNIVESGIKHHNPNPWLNRKTDKLILRNLLNQTGNQRLLQMFLQMKKMFPWKQRYNLQYPQHQRLTLIKSLAILHRRKEESNVLLIQIVNTGKNIKWIFN